MLPRSRNFTYGAGSALRSADLDDLQDGEIGAKHGLVWEWFPTLVAPSLTNITFHPYRLQANADNAGIDGHLVGPLLAGTTIVAGKANVFGQAAAGNVTVGITLCRPDGTQATLLAATIVHPPAAWATYDLTLDVAFPTGHVLLPGEYLTSTILLDKNTAAIQSIGLEIARD